jgi:tetratricopeptide (TPR) repeat protein
MKAVGRILLALIVFGLAGTFLAQGENVTILRPKVSPNSPENVALVNQVVQWSLARANDLYTNYINVDYNQRGQQADYSVQVNAYFSDTGSNLNVQVVRNRDGAESTGVPILGEITAQSAIHVANTIFYQWSSFHDYLTRETTEAPEYVEEIPLDLISQSLFGMNSMLAPWSVAVKTDSNILIGTSTVCLEMDRYFRVLDQPGRELYDNGEYGYANIVAVTPAGTPFFKNLSSGKVIKWFGSGIKPQSWKIGPEFMGSFTALPDGSALVAHAGQQQTLRLKDRKPTEVEFLTKPDLYYSAIAADPDGNIWIFSTAERRVRIYTTEGQLVDSIIPLSPDRPVPTQMAVYADGSFLFFAQGWLYRFRRNGVPLWRTNELLGPDEFASLNHAGVAPDVRTGLIYLADVQGRRIIKLLDRAYAGEMGIANQSEQALIQHNRRLARNPDDTEALIAKADLYERIGSIEMARSMWQKVLEIDPSSAEAQRKLEGFELIQLKVRAAELEEKTRSIIDSLGPESARAPFSQTMQLYEKILSLDPSDREIQRKRRELKILFEESQRRITITAAKIDDLFPSLMQQYRTHPIGTVTVRNVLDEEVRELKASLFIEGYMDFPTESIPLSRLKAKGEATLDLKVLFNTAVFKLQEDLPVQGKIEVSYQTARGEQKTSKVEELMLYRKTALVWDDSAKLASFIMPNEEIVSTFAHRVSDIEAVEKKYRLASRLFRGIRVCDALGAYGIAYVEDPDSPISRVLGKSAVVDTVRFPRMTLLIQSGDCDDTSALLGSLLESVGVSTAIMTSPGHVFLAFDTGEPKENLWLFSHRNLEAISHQGTVWLPVETTLLAEGFLSAWEAASKLVRKHRGKIEFLPVGEQRNRYPPLPLPATDLSVFEPPDQEIGAVFSRSIAAVEDTLYRDSLNLLEDKLRGEEGIRAVHLRNQIGVLHARFGKDQEAEAELSRCLSEDPDFIAPYLNLANLKMMRGELEEAVEVARAGLKRKPDSALLNIFLALYHNRKGEPRRAAEYLEKVRGSSPELARRYSYLADSSAAQGRAGAAAEEHSLIWDSGE